MKKRILSVIIAVTMLLMPVVTLAETKTPLPEGYTITKALRNYVKAYFQFDVTDEKMLDSVIENILKEHPEMFETIADGIMNSLDEHSMYFNQEEFDAFNAYIESEFGGIGAYLTREDGYIKIVNVMDGTPAKKAGLMDNDKILAVDGVSIVGFDTDMAVSKLRGKKGTDVVITIEREGIGKFEVTVTRDIIKQKTVDGVLVEDKIGYINIINFGSTTAKEFEDKYNELKGQGADRFILDLRNNTGGLTDQSLAIASAFVPKGAKLLEVKSKVEGQSTTYTNVFDGQLQKVVVLTNEYTASASEILAGAIKDNKGGTLVGTKTYGKGTMQNMLGLGSYGGFKLTIAEFFSPLGNTINKVGIKPDIEVTNLTRQVEASDLQPLTYTTKYQIGDDSDEILAAKYRLRILKYFNGNMDNYYDGVMEQAVKNFQAANGLYPYGVLDFSTQIMLNNLAMEGDITFDTQYEKALEVVKAM